MNSFSVSSNLNAFGDSLKRQWMKIARLNDLFIFELNVKKPYQKKHTCEICKKKIYINWDGSFYPCVQFQNIPEYLCGDVFEGIKADID